MQCHGSILDRFPTAPLPVGTADLDILLRV